MIYLVDFWTLIFNNFVDLKAIQKKCDKKISPIKGDGTFLRPKLFAYALPTKRRTKFKFFANN